MKESEQSSRCITVVVPLVMWSVEITSHTNKQDICEIGQNERPMFQKAFRY
jgi:hypothetical protein